MHLFLPMLPALVAPVVQSSFDDAYLAIATGGIHKESNALGALGTVAGDPRVILPTNGSRANWYVRGFSKDDISLSFSSI